MKGFASRFLPACWRVIRRADLLLVLLCLAVCLLMVQRYGGLAGEVAVTVEDIAGAAPKAAGAGATDGGGQAGVGWPVPADMPKGGPPVRFLMFNVESYFVPGEEGRSRYVNKAKPPASRDAVARAIAAARPGIVALIEMGGPRALDDLKSRLERLGLHYPHSVIVLRGGEDRALALLSRYPIVRDDSQPHFGLFGQQRRQLLRGLLDVTVAVGDGRLFRFVGAHLKSRVTDDRAAADSLRRREAQTVARYLHRIMSQQPGMPVLLFGDWNDGPDDESVQVLRQGIARNSAMVRLKPRDSRGEFWTIFHRQAQQYYTFDQMYANRVLSRRLGRDVSCGIVDADGVAGASDHRPLWVELR